MKAKRLLLLLFLVAYGTSIVAQQQDLSPWTNNLYGNEWIDYSKKYVRVGITKDGMYKIPLATLKTRLGELGEDLNENNVQAWFRGKQIALLIQNGDVIFYGRKNDGVSDGLMFRNDNGRQIDPSQRLNTHDSFYSEQGAHFFTWAKPAEMGNLRRILTVNAEPGDATPEETFHTETLIESVGQYYQPAGRRENMNFGFRASTAIKTLNSSFFQSVNAFIEGSTKLLQESFLLKNIVTTASDPVTLSFSLHGNFPGGRTFKVKVAPDVASLNSNIVNTTTFSGFSGIKVAGVDKIELSSQNFSSSGAGVIQFERTGDAGGPSFYEISYPQSLSFSGSSNKRYYFKNGISGKRQVKITDIGSDAKVFNINDSFNPSLIAGRYQGSTLAFDIDRTSNDPLLLQVASGSGFLEPDGAHINDVSFDLLYSSYTDGPTTNTPINPSEFDFLIITHTSLISGATNYVKDGAIKYGRYRAGTSGGNHKTLVISTRTIYDQFNYGEPSPIAIGRFVNYMIQNGVRDTHNVLLVGHGVGRPTNIYKELPFDVPTYGNPGSDILLVSGLSNAPNSNIDVPAVPIGRIVAFDETQVENYLNKVQEYESQTKSNSDLAWRRNLISLIGNKTTDEPGLFNQYVTTAENQVNHATGPWTINRISNQTALNWPPVGDYPRTDAPIDALINSGVGMLGYYGHGDFSLTVYDIGVAGRFTQADKKYPFLYITGCGVGDVYESHGISSATSVIANTWITTKDKGAIAMLANTFLAYTNTAASYMEEFYRQIFTKMDSDRRPIGQIQVNMARIKVTGSQNGSVSTASLQEVANVHQIALFGDPSIRILVTSDVALPVSYLTFSGEQLDGNSIQLQWETVWEQNNDRFIVERSANGHTFEEIGSVASKMVESSTEKRYYFNDLSAKPGKNYYRLKQLDLAGDGSKESPAFSYSNIISVLLKPNGISNEVVVYPVPTNNTIHILSPRNFQLVKWRLFDNLGRVVLNGTDQTINLDNLVGASFLLEISGADNSTIRKHIVKQ